MQVDMSGVPIPSSAPYRGRFAPSPTGPLHFGSLLAALGSWLLARHAGGQWLVRIEDLDPPREVAGAARQQLRTLAAEGGVHHACVATGPRPDPSIRFRVPAGSVVAFDDAIQGHVEQDVAATVGDFVLRRADGWWAYQLAVVVDDAAEGITDVVRGADLLDSTPRQILLQRALGLPTPRHAHLPLVLDADGRKLSKSTASLPVDATDPLPALRAAWRALGQPVHALDGAGSAASALRMAQAAFIPEAIPAGPMHLPM